MPLLTIGISVLILDEGNNILLIKRADNDLWGLPAGSIELNESPETAAIREVKEETGLDIKSDDLNLINVFGGEEFFYTYPNGDQCSNIIISYSTRKFSGNLVQTTDETRESRFFNHKNLPQDIAKHEKIVLDYFIEHDKKE